MLDFLEGAGGVVVLVAALLVAGFFVTTHSPSTIEKVAAELACNPPGRAANSLDCAVYRATGRLVFGIR